ncbi:hypothetical protein J8J40_30945, partial [Mycobacterium tuberculosis]|nr:hypothetical protein [Mycobacterium tuberculosis]
LARAPGALRPLYGDPAFAAERIAMLEELLRWSIRTEDCLPRAKYEPKTVPHGWQRGIDAGAGPATRTTP